MTSCIHVPTSGFQQATEVILEVLLKSDSNDLSPMCISYKITNYCYLKAEFTIVMQKKDFVADI